MTKNKDPHWIVSFLLNLVATSIGVLLAFSLSNRADLKKSKEIEISTLTEIKKELQSDVADLIANSRGHEIGIKAVSFFEKIINNEIYDADSFHIYYVSLLRDFISLQQTAAYQTLKSRGLEIISTDSLRIEIVKVYDLYFAGLEKLEEEYTPHEFHENYFEYITSRISPIIDFKTGKMIPAKNLSFSSQNELTLVLKKIKYDRSFSISFYQESIANVNNLIKLIDAELNQK